MPPADGTPPKVRLALYQSDIPQNLGATLRLAACLGVAVDIIEPCGFPLTDKALRRTAMDYGKNVEIVRHDGWTAFQDVKDLGAVRFAPMVRYGAVSRDGRHYVSEIWLDHRQSVSGAGVVCDLAVLLPADGDVQHELARYARACLDAVGIRLGPSSLEIIVTADGPVLIDLGARMMGTQDFAVLSSVLGTSQVELTAACYAAPERFESLTARPYRARAPLWVVTLINRHRGRLIDESFRGRLAALPSCRSLIGAPTPGQLLVPTVDEATCYGSAFFSHDDAQQLERDYRAVRALEHEGRLFRLEPEPEPEPKPETVRAPTPPPCL